MYLHLGQEAVIRHSEIIGVFDVDNTTVSPHTREFLQKAEQDGRVTYVSYELPKGFVVCAEGRRSAHRAQVYVTQVSPATLKKRSRKMKNEE